MKQQTLQRFRRACPEPCRRDGWTIRRQLAFLDTLARTGSVTAAARAAGMSRESAYRLRRRNFAALFAASWDRAVEGRALSGPKGHSGVNFASLRRGRQSAGLQCTSTKGHEVHDPRDSLNPRSIS